MTLQEELLCALLTVEAFMVMFLLTDTTFFLESDEKAVSFSVNDT